MTPEQAAQLRAEFKPEQIGKLPKVNCPACTKANKERRGTTCDQHKKIKCDVCKNWISERHIHLDYVGHAATTDRLLQVDPEWTWEPITPDEQHCLPDRGLWIKLTVAGVTRFGYGDGDDPKVQIGDAIRNAAMRFGVALDLWAKEDLRPDESSGSVEGSTSASTAVPPGPEPSPPSFPPEGGTAGDSGSGVPSEPGSPAAIPASRMQRAKSRVGALLAAKVSVADERTKRLLPPLNDEITAEEFDLFCAMLDDLEAKLPV